MRSGLWGQLGRLWGLNVGWGWRKVGKEGVSVVARGIWAVVVSRLVYGAR